MKSQLAVDFSILNDNNITASFQPGSLFDASHSHLNDLSLKRFFVLPDVTAWLLLLYSKLVSYFVKWDLRDLEPLGALVALERSRDAIALGPRVSKPHRSHGIDV